MATAAGTASAPACTPADDAAGAGCEAEFSSGPAGLRLALKHCFLDDGDRLFDCELSAEQESTLRDSASVAVGCGCQSTCPGDPGIEICAGSSCRAAGIAAAATVPEVNQVVVTTGGAGTTEATVCPTCCEIDFTEYQTAVAVQPAALSEIELTIPFFPGDGCHNWNCYAGTYSPRNTMRREGSLVRVCLADEIDVNDMVSCVVDFSLDLARATVVRVLDADLRPIEPRPTIHFE